MSGGLRHGQQPDRHSTIRLTFGTRPFTFNHMVELESPELTSVFHALGDATRRRMLRELAGGERTVGQLAQPFAISLAAASKHIKVLENAGLIRREVRGRTHLCRLDPGPRDSAQEWLSFYERCAPGRGTRRAKGTGPPLRPQGCSASLTRRLPVPQVRGGHGLDPGDLCGPSGRKHGQAQPCPTHRRSASGEPGAHATDDPANVDEERTATALSTPRDQVRNYVIAPLGFAASGSLAL